MSGEWAIFVVNEVREWIDSLDDNSRDRVAEAIDVLAEEGPALGRPLVDTIHGSSIANLKELRPGSIRILFAFDLGGARSCWWQATRPADGTLGTRQPSRWPRTATRST